MTTAEDMLFLEIIDTVGKMNLSTKEQEVELMTQFARVYKAKIDNKEWKETEFSDNLKNAVRYYIPEEYL